MRRKALIVTTAQLAEFFGVARQTIGRYVDQGMPKKGTGQFDLADCIKWRVDRFELEMRERLSRLSVGKQEARILRARANTAQRKVMRALKASIPATEAVAVWEKITQQLRRHATPLPGRIAARVWKLESVQEIHAAMQDEIYKLLEGLAASSLGKPRKR